MKSLLNIYRLVYMKSLLNKVGIQVCYTCMKSLLNNIQVGIHEKFVK